MSDEPGRGGRPPGDRERPKYTVYRSRPGFLSRFRREPQADRLDQIEDLRAARRRPAQRPGRKPWTAGRVVRWVAVAIAAWIGLSLVLFMVSAQIQTSKVSSSAESALDGGGFPLTSASTILVLGSDARSKNAPDCGSSGCGGPSRSDTIMLIRSGLGHSAKLSIPRDTVVDIPGHGPDKINAAFAIGGPALAVTTIKRYLGIKINHLVQIDFSNFKKFIDTAGGIDVKTGRVCAQISGGAKNGGWTLDYKPGVHHLSGRQALGYSRMRENPCDPRDSDLTRGQHQQQVLNALKSALISPRTFFRLPWVSWQAPKTIRTDMGGPSLMALLSSMELSGTSKTRVLVDRPPHFVAVNGGAGLQVSDATRRAEVHRFLNG